jgi:arylsulfatase A-like enzyme
MFTLTSPNLPPQGERDGVGLLDLAPTLMDLAGFAIPESMQGRSLLDGMERLNSASRTEAEDAEKAVHDRLAGLGYI